MFNLEYLEKTVKQKWVYWELKERKNRVGVGEQQNPDDMKAKWEIIKEKFKLRERWGESSRGVFGKAIWKHILQDIYMLLI